MVEQAQVNIFSDPIRLKDQYCGDSHRLGKLPSKEQQLLRTQHFILKAHAAVFVLHKQYGPLGNTADPYHTTTELSPINIPPFKENY